MLAPDHAGSLGHGSSRGPMIRCLLVVVSLIGAIAGCGTGGTTGPAPEDAGDQDAGTDSAADASPPDAGCVPGTVLTQGCGRCGTLTRTCTEPAVFAAGACTAEPANACQPGMVDYTSEGCVTPATFRNRTCGPTCAFGSYSATCEPR